MPRLACVASSASVVPPALHDSRNAATAGFARGRAQRERMLRRDRAERDAHDRVGARREHVEPAAADQPASRVADVVQEGEAHALALAEPVLLHQLDALGPAGQAGLHALEQLVGVLRDLQVVAGNLALLDQRARAPAAALDHLLVGEHGLVDRIPVDDLRAPLGDAGLEHLQEEPLVPLVVRRIAGRDLAAPVDRQAERLHLRLHRGDVVARPARRRHAVLHRRVLGRQAERVPAHRHQHVHAGHAQLARQHVVDRVVAHVAHVQPAARVRQHRAGVELGPARVLDDAIGVGGAPCALRELLDLVRFEVGFHARARRRTGIVDYRKRLRKAGDSPKAGAGRVLHRGSDAPDSGSRRRSGPQRRSRRAASACCEESRCRTSRIPRRAVAPCSWPALRCCCPRIAPASPSPWHSAAALAPELASVYAGQVDPARCLVSEKYDGVRAVWDGSTLRHRSGRIVSAPANFLAALPAEPLDGELWLGRGRFEPLSALVRRNEPRESEWRAGPLHGVRLAWAEFDVRGAPAPAGRARAARRPRRSRSRRNGGSPTSRHCSETSRARRGRRRRPGAACRERALRAAAARRCSS